MRRPETRPAAAARSSARRRGPAAGGCSRPPVPCQNVAGRVDGDRSAAAPSVGRSCESCRCSGSHSFTTRSPPPRPASCPGAERHGPDRLPCPRKTLRGGPSRGRTVAPDGHCRRWPGLAVGGKRDALGSPRCAQAGRRPRVRVPEPHHPVAAGRGQSPAVARPRHGLNRDRVRVELAGPPSDPCPTPARRRRVPPTQGAAVVVERQRFHLIGVAGQRGQLESGIHVPQMNQPIAARRGDQATPLATRPQSPMGSPGVLQAALL